MGRNSKDSREDPHPQPLSQAGRGGLEHKLNSLLKYLGVAVQSQTRKFRTTNQRCRAVAGATMTWFDQ